MYFLFIYSSFSSLLSVSLIDFTNTLRSDNILDLISFESIDRLLSIAFKIQIKRSNISNHDQQFIDNILLMYY